MSPPILKPADVEGQTKEPASPDKERNEIDIPANPGTELPTKKIHALPTTPSGPSGSITAWGSTTGKLYLSDPRLNDPQSRSVITRFFWKTEAEHAEKDGKGEEKQGGEASEAGKSTE
ncbi:hypothetical protein A1O3_02346 [Capronia epimyces CBS 606.96]|uniref:Uncharacterized protein n=1 Tax=Capronia epimyces CBS 606.96 TaxID=1182542 RepID=W9YHX4_9EURO|nr:uncharacterized protein A1O3_02346 [Capronia epimyces CBS 606.96]EXJ89280.1 hypothetical protein A1O3_02346 [Capronia epimyces CBS 606.96]